MRAGEEQGSIFRESWLWKRRCIALRLVGALDFIPFQAFLFWLLRYLSVDIQGPLQTRH